MAAEGKGTSTERLLELIKGKEGGPPAAPGKGKGAKGKAPRGKAPKGKAPKGRAPKGKAPKAPKGKSQVKIRSTAGGGSARVVGVDIGPEALRMVVVSRSGGKNKVLDVRKTEYGNVSPEGPDFPGFLRQELKTFGGLSKTVEVWSHISTAKSELWHIRIPKVPRKQIVDAVFWTVKKEKQFDENEFVLDFEVQGEIQEKGAPKLAIMVYLVPRKQIDDLTRLYNQAGVKLTGITISPIAIQTLFRTGWVQSPEITRAHLYVGRNWSRIEIFIGNDLVLSRGIKAGSNSMIEALMDSYNLQVGHQPTPAKADSEPVISLSLDDDALAESMGMPSATSAGSRSAQPKTMDFDQAKRVLWAKLLGYTLQEGEPGAELSEIDTLKMIRPAAERLIRQVERTFEYHTTTMGNERVEKIFFSGELSSNPMLIKYIHSQLGIECQIMDPLDPATHALGKSIGSLTTLERLSYNLPVALALSSNVITPNLLFTYKDKEKIRRSKAVEKVLAMVAFVCLLGLVGIYVWLMQEVKVKETELQQYKSDYEARFTPPVTKESLLAMASKVAEKDKRMRRASQRYESMGVISEITERTPEKIKVINLTLDFGRGPEIDSVAAGGASDKLLIFEGILTGNPETFMSDLTMFRIKLQESKMFQDIVIDSSEEEDFPGTGRVLHFIMHMNIL